MHRSPTTLLHSPLHAVHLAPLALRSAPVGHLSPVLLGDARRTMRCDGAAGAPNDLIAYRHPLVTNAVDTGGALLAPQTRAVRYEVPVTDRSAERAVVAVRGRRAVPLPSHHRPR